MVQKRCIVCDSVSMAEDRVLNNIRLLRCRDCSHVFADLVDGSIFMDNEKRYEKIYNSTSQEADRDMDLYKNDWFDSVVNRITAIKGKGSVLDVGCGNGGLLLMFKKRGWKVTGVDMSEQAAFFAGKNGYDIVIGKLEEAGFADGSFDCITATNVLEHIPDPVAFCKKIVDPLKPGGVAYLNVPNYGSFSIRLGFSRFSRNKPPHHFSYFTARSLDFLFREKAGSGRLKTVKITSYGIPELHYLLSRLKAKKKKSGAGTAGEVRPVPGERKRKKEGAISGLLKKTAIHLVYYFGRPFRLGDKLECLIVKSD